MCQNIGSAKHRVRTIYLVLVSVSPQGSIIVRSLALLGIDCMGIFFLHSCVYFLQISFSSFGIILFSPCSLCFTLAVHMREVFSVGYTPSTWKQSLVFQSFWIMLNRFVMGLHTSDIFDKNSLHRLTVVKRFQCVVHSTIFLTCKLETQDKPWHCVFQSFQKIFIFVFLTEYRGKSDNW